MKNKNVSREKVLKTVDEERKQNNWRYGQALFNSTFLYYPDFAEARRGTEDDPFNSDNILDHVCQKWLYELKIYIEDLKRKEITNQIFEERKGLLALLAKGPGTD